jgi:hypothetical protein
MKLTNREKILLPAALFIIGVALFINFITWPLIKDIGRLFLQKEDIKIQISDAKVIQSEIEAKKEQIKMEQEKFASENENILKIWDQPELLAYIEETIDPLCEKKSINFFDTVSAGDVQAGEISIMINTNYDDLKKILEQFDQAKYYNTITSIMVKHQASNLPETEAEKNDLEVSISLWFYTQNSAAEYPENYDFMPGEYGKSNLFQ